MPYILGMNSATQNPCYLVETCDIPRNGQLCVKVWLERSSMESAERTRQAFVSTHSLAIVEFLGDFEYRIS